MTRVLDSGNVSDHIYLDKGILRLFVSETRGNSSAPPPCSNSSPAPPQCKLYSPAPPLLIKRQVYPLTLTIIHMLPTSLI
jgi:hypothetical protein